MEPAVLEEFLEFFRVFVEQAHYEKEESALFAALKKNGVPASEQLLAVLRNEHMKGRGLLTELAHSVSVYMSAKWCGQRSTRKSPSTHCSLLFEPHVDGGLLVASCGQ